MRIVRQGVVGAAVVALLLTGCSGSGDDAPEGSVPAAEKGGESGAGVESFDAGKAIVKQTVTLPKSPEDKVTFGVLSLTVKGKVMELRLAVTPDFASTSKSDTVRLFDSMSDTSFAPTLVDLDNLKEYSVIVATGSGPRWLSNDVETISQNGTPMLAYAYFAAPEDDIDDIDVRVTDFWPAFTNVPITR